MDRPFRASALVLAALSAPACGQGGAKGGGSVDEVLVDILEPVDGQLVQHTVAEVMGEAVFPEDLDASVTWAQWSSSPAGALASAVCDETLDGAVLQTRCTVDTTEPVDWVALDVGTDTADGPLAGGTTLLVIWRDNTVPSVSISAPEDGAELEAPAMVELLLSDDDPPDSLSVTWTSDVQGALEPTDAARSADGTYTALLPLDAGAHLLTVTVADQWDVSTVASVSVIVSD